MLTLGSFRTNYQDPTTDIDIKREKAKAIPAAGMLRQIEQYFIKWPKPKI